MKNSMNMVFIANVVLLVIALVVDNPSWMDMSVGGMFSTFCVRLLGDLV